ncbi:MAG TPA: hypothetical protein PKA28_10905 [Methylomusa anaerophila]|uniref:Uncharacterized protein n=1 Tax=Methylomusa anaerophila TaxID=1930071 RepID=A0A348AJ21_9FIRM|nr:hypothetical protein [Methylomusa anaerophila]BBB91069.1 hypothetical protein MAMMFC1_01737 [Methylomusa anaerophila]HML88944.1 hypothetical protein [Methylomusa anaerophila]
MGQRMNRESTAAEKEAKSQKQELLDTQELAADLYEQNLALQNQLLDTQELLAQVIEGGVA